MLRPFARSTSRGSENFAVVADQNKWNAPGSMSHRQSDRRLTEVGGRGDYFARNLAKQIGRVPSFVTPDEEPSHAEHSGRLVFFPVQSTVGGFEVERRAPAVRMGDHCCSLPNGNRQERLSAGWLASR